MAKIIDRKTTEAGKALALVSRGNSFWLVEQVNGKWADMTTELSETVARRIYNGMA